MPWFFTPACFCTSELFFLEWLCSLFSNRPTLLPSGKSALLWHLLQFSPERAAQMSLYWEKLLILLSLRYFLGWWWWWWLVLFCIFVAWNLIQHLGLSKCCLSVVWNSCWLTKLPYKTRFGKSCVRTIFRIPQLQVGFHFPVLIPFVQRWFFIERSFSWLWGLCEAVVLEKSVKNKEAYWNALVTKPFLGLSGLSCA